MGSFFVVNLILAVINSSFLKINEKRKKELQEEEKRIKELIK
jgi:Na+/melibiose symporter-like transporter